MREQHSDAQIHPALAPVESSPAPPLPAPESFSFPVDPRRLVGALRRHRLWVLVGACLGLAFGVAFGMWRAKTRYEVSLELIKRYTQPTFAFGINGEPYKPRVFTNSTLASAARSSNVLERVAKRSGRNVSADLLKASITVKEDRVTDFVTLTLSDYESAEQTVALAKLWTDEIISFTREMQSQDSREIRKVLETQLGNNEQELEKLDQATLKMTGGTRALGGDLQVDSFLEAQADADAKYDAARADLQAVNTKVAGVKAELQQLTPATEELRAARVELEQYRGRYTDQNPLVVDRMEKVTALEAQLKKPNQPPAPTDVNSLTGTFVSNALYLRLVELENQRDALERQVQDLEKKREKSSEGTADKSRLMEVLQKKQMLRTAQSLLLSRMQEVRLFEENPPAFYGVFAPADLDRVESKLKSMKVVVFSFAGLMCGTMFGFCGVLLAGYLDPKLRTAAEASKTLGAPLLGALTAGGAPEDAPEIAAHLWGRWIGATVGVKRARAIWAPAPDASEDAFWRAMLAQARKLLPALVVVDCGDVSPAALNDSPRNTDGAASDFAIIHHPISGCSLAEARKFGEMIDLWLSRGCEVWVRFSGPVQEPATTLARSLLAPLVLVPLHRTSTAFWKDQAAVLRHSGCAPCGVIALNDAPLSQADEKAT